MSFRSEKIPKISIINVKSMKEKIFSSRKLRYPSKIKTPPVNGTVDFEANF